MRRPTVILAFTGLALAGSTIYLALRLRAARDELANLHAQLARPPSTAAAGETASDHATANAPASGATHAGPGRNPGSSAATDARAEEREALRATLADPDLRQKTLDRITDLYNAGGPGAVNRYVGLSEGEYTRLMRLLTDHQLQQLEARYQCAQNPQCDDLSIFQSLIPEQTRQLTEMLGADRKRRLDTFLNDLPELTTVAYLRSHLPESEPLSDAQADKLSGALGDERRRVIQEIEQRGTTYSYSSSLHGNVVIPQTAQGVDEKYSQAQEYQRRLSDRAGQVLNSQQLSVFDKNQEDFLARLRRGWEDEERNQNKP